MRSLVLKVAILFAVTTTSAIGFQATPGEGGGPAVPWRFTDPVDGKECQGAVLFAGTGPNSQLGGLSVYSYTDTVPGEVVASELQLQMAVIVTTDPGVEWVGPIYEQVGENYATIMPALGTLNLMLLSLDGDEIGISTLVSLSGGQGVLFRIVEP